MHLFSSVGWDCSVESEFECKSMFENNIACEKLAYSPGII